MDAPMSEEDRVICLLASLPESFSMLVTALEASEAVPRMEVVTERLLHEERKLKVKEENLEEVSEEKVMVPRFRRRGVCYNCGKYGHHKWECPKQKPDDHRANNVAMAGVMGDSSDSDALIVGHQALSVGMTSGWIVDSGATCHMCGTRALRITML